MGDNSDWSKKLFHDSESEMADIEEESDSDDEQTRNVPIVELSQNAFAEIIHGKASAIVKRGLFENKNAAAFKRDLEEWYVRLFLLVKVANILDYFFYSWVLYAIFRFLNE
ncbi:unnamed protein product [Caenorhabditis angaria]|uniref:Uncharacterized protein n=1 Tax=Caenorhabditis angaria TaxID=860376 RepID=A0A9P1J305_9PELO|nr:unnamed protein product [Caenorhabditis angaria]